MLCVVVQGGAMFNVVSCHVATYMHACVYMYHACAHVSCVRMCMRALLFVYTLAIPLAHELDPLHVKIKFLFWISLTFAAFIDHVGATGAPSPWKRLPESVLSSIEQAPLPSATGGGSSDETDLVGDEPHGSGSVSWLRS